MKPIFSSLFVLVFVVALTTKATFAQTSGGPSVSKIAALLEQSGHKYAKIKEGIWQIDFQGENLKEFKLFITSVSGQLLMFVDLAPRSDLNLNNGLAAKLLELNDAMDTVKFALSEKSLYLRIEAHERIIDLQEFKYMISQVSQVADDAVPQLKPFLRK